MDDYVGENNPVRVVDAFVAQLDLAALGFTGVVPEATGRPSYHPLTLLKIYLYGYLNRIASSRRLEREAQRNMELMWLTGRLIPDFKTIADFRKDQLVSVLALDKTLHPRPPGHPSPAQNTRSSVFTQPGPVAAEAQFVVRR